MLMCVGLLLAISPAAARPVAAQSSTPGAAIMAETSDGIVFYGLTENNTLEKVGGLPKNFTLEVSQEKQMLGGCAGYNAVLSPNGQQIAFTTQTYGTESDEGETGFYIYDLRQGTLKPIPTENFARYGGIRLQWSPDSDAILFQSTGCCCDVSSYPDAFSYEVASGVWHTLSNMPGNLVGRSLTWTPDSQSVGYDSYDRKFYLVRRDGGNRRFLVGGPTFPNIPPDAYPDVCNFAWSETQQRWYYELGCLGRTVDMTDSWDYLYSINLQRDNRLEADLPTIYNAEFPATKHYNRLEYVNITTIHPVNQSINVVLGMREILEDAQNDTTSSNTHWRVIQIDQPEHVTTLFDGVNHDENALVAAVFAPDNRQVALIGGSSVVIANLETGQEDIQIAVEMNYHDDVRWLDSHALLYSQANTVWLLNTDNGRRANLTASIAGQARILPQTNSFGFRTG